MSTEFLKMIFSVFLKSTTRNILFLFILAFDSDAQTIAIEDSWKSISNKQFVKISGGASTSLIHHNGTRPDAIGRLPWIYNLSGNLTMTFLQNFSVPVSYNLSNARGTFSYPTVPNRLSLHPTYRGITTHFGDFTMSFSPYTFNGHRIRGIGVDVIIKDRIKVSSFYGILNQPVQYDSSNITLPAVYKRLGYGLNVLYTVAKTTAGISYFIGKDEQQSIQALDDSLRIYPKENMAVGLKLGHHLGQNISLEGEYALSIITEDIRVHESTNNGFNSLNPIHINSSSNQRSAFKIRGSYSFFKKVLGIGYERVAPGYQTMGAYYFCNDFENFTLDFSCAFKKGKIQFASKGGLQQDNLDKSKAGTNQRYIGSAQLSGPIGKKVQLAFNYSNFQNYMRMKNQFESINQSLPSVSGDTLNFIQVNHNASTNISYMLQRSAECIQNIILNGNVQKSSNQQGGHEIKNANVLLYNGMIAYTINLVASHLSMTVAFNTTYTIMIESTLFYGPAISVNKRLVKDQMMIGLSASYNRAEVSNLIQSEILNVRGTLRFTYHKRHILSNTLLFQHRDQTQKDTSDIDFTGTLTYSFNF